MHRIKSTARRRQIVAASSSGSKDDLSLGADHEEAVASTCDAASSSMVSQRKGGVPSQWGQFTSKYQAQWKDDLSMSICLGFSFLYTYNIIYEQLINILLILFNFRFTNIEAAQTITSAFKLLMEIPLFQWSQVSRHPEWRPNIDAWFRRFQVGVNF
jgi:hypothetical protein